MSIHIAALPGTTRVQGASRSFRGTGSHVDRQRNGEDGKRGVIESKASSTAGPNGDRERFRRAFTDSPIATALGRVRPPDVGRIFEVNAAACELVGYSERELAEMEFQTLIFPDDLERDAELVDALLAGRLGRARVEKRIVRSDGRLLWVQVDRSVLRDASGAPHYLLTQIQDIGDHRRTVRRLECERAVGRVLAQSVTGEGALAALLAALGDLLECDVGVSWMQDESFEQLSCEGTWRSERFDGSATLALGREIALGPGEGLPGRVWESGSAAFATNMPGDVTCPRAGAAARDGLSGGLAIPIAAANEILGVVELLSRRPEPDPDLLEVLDAIGRDVGAFFVRRRAERRSLDVGRLLLVEDDEFIATLVGEMLAGLATRFELVHVETLAAGRDQVFAAKPSCVLLDLTLPDAEGLQGLLELRKLAPDVPIVVLTGHEDETLATRAVQEGAQDYLVKRKVDMDSLARSIRYAVERKRAEQRVFEDSLQDRLTGLPNGVLLLDRLRLALARAMDSGELTALLHLDIKRFRLVNDSLGYRNGDRVICATAERVRGALSPDVTVAALGADHFAVLCERMPHPRAAVEVAERLLAAVRLPLAVGGEELRLDATVGIALGDGRDREPDALLHEAETAGARAREHGSEYEVFEQAARERIRERLLVEHGLRAALEHDQLRLAYQPIVSLAGGGTLAFEALLRWEHPDRGLVSPGDFIPVAEESGLIVPIGGWALREACRQLGRWRAAEAADGVRINVNLAASQVTEPALPAAVSETIAGAGIEPEDVCLEITESSLMHDVGAALEVLRGLKQLGVRLALDDFGTGYSSLGHLRRFPIDELKVDRSLVTGLGRDERMTAIVAAIVTMGRALGMPVIAEGVETADDAERLRVLGCALGQGYHFARPLPSEEAAGLLRAECGVADHG